MDVGGDVLYRAYVHNQSSTIYNVFCAVDSRTLSTMFRRLDVSYY